MTMSAMSFELYVKRRWYGFHRLLPSRAASWIAYFDILSESMTFDIGLALGLDS